MPEAPDPHISPTAQAAQGEPSASAAVASARETAARQQVAALKGFYVHLVVFVLVVAGLAVIDWGAGGAWWVHWVLLGWGIGVAAHAFGVFSNVSRRVADWEEQKVREIMREEQRPGT